MSIQTIGVIILAIIMSILGMFFSGDGYPYYNDKFHRDDDDDDKDG